MSSGLRTLRTLIIDIKAPSNYFGQAALRSLESQNQSHPSPNLRKTCSIFTLLYIGHLDAQLGSTHKCSARLLCPQNIESSRG